ncbi:MAG: histidinol-phosphate aminotransferase family protein [Thermoplasmatales archaeon]|nr:histidinol-phosphate aminotransferase family protein [Thermoplasmatales archaeon]
MPPTVHGGRAWKLGDVEDFSHNLNPFGPPDFIGEIMASAASEVWHYPDDDCSQLKGVIAGEFSLDPSNVMVGAGSSELIRAFPQVFLDKGDRAVIPRPSFAEYAHQCRIAGVQVVDSLLTESDDFRIDEKRLRDLVSRGAKALYVCNPNNPTGRIEPRDKILGIVEYCMSKGVMVFLDETLLELVPCHRDVSCSAYVDEYPNLVVACSLTKSFAIPGIRIGFGFAAPETAAHMDKVRMTWNVGAVEQLVATELIGKHMPYVERAADMMRSESVWMYDQLKEIGFPVTTRPDSFFFFNSLKPLGIDAPGFVDRMLDHRIMVRDCSSFGMPFGSYVRFCVKDRERNTAFVHAVHDVLRSLGW